MVEKVTKEVYETLDGKFFDTVIEAIDYERLTLMNSVVKKIVNRVDGSSDDMIPEFSQGIIRVYSDIKEVMEAYENPILESEKSHA